MEKPIEIFFCYAHEDEEFRQSLEKQLSALKRQGLIDVWHDRQVHAGSEWKDEINRHLNTAQVILLLVSPDFMDSDYINSIEMERAMERHQSGEAHVIPVILRPTLWQGALFGELQALPMDAIPVVSRQWHHQDEAFFSIAQGIKRVAESLIPLNKGKAKEIGEAEQRRMGQVNPQQPVTGKYSVQITGTVQSFHQGDHNTITQTFSNISKEK